MTEKIVFVTGIFFLLVLVISRANSPVGFVEISSIPAGATVSIDDVPRGTTPATGSLEVSLPAGKHTLVVTKEGYTSYVGAFQVERGETKNISIELENLNF